MKYLLFFTCLCACFVIDQKSFAQTFNSADQTIYFSSEAALDNFEAASDQATYEFNSNSNELKIEVPLASFQYEASLKQSSLGGDFLDTKTHPVAVFIGKVSGVEKKNGDQSGKLTGSWTLGGKTVEAQCDVDFSFGQGIVQLAGSFDINTYDFDFEYPEELEFYISDLCLLEFETEMKISNQ